MKRFLLTASLMLLAALSGRADEPKAKEKPKEEKPVAVPFGLLKTKHITIDVKVNGKGPYRVLFDTGAPMTVLNNKLARAAGLPKGGGLLGGQTTEVKTLEVGDVKAEKVPVVVMDHPLVELMSMEKGVGPLYGIVGFPFFARYKMALDYKAKTMTLTPNGFEPPDVRKELESTIEGLLGGRQPPKVLAPAAQWGLVAGKAKDDEEAGVTLKEVLPGGAAAAAGLKAGDRLLTLDGRWTDSLADLYLAAGFVKPGTAVKVVVTRGKKEMTFTVKPTSGL
jgi:membrane-associated protease RseP (regulator of RpoE activity)